MNKTSLFIIIGIIIIAVVAFAVTRPKQVTVSQETENTGNTPTDVQGATPNTEATTPTTSGKKMAFGEFVKQGGSYQCTVDEYLDPSYTATTKGAIYLSNGLVRGDFAIDAGGESMKTSFIKRDGFVYTWIPGTSPGYKTAAQETAPASGQSGWTPDMVGNYDCKPWTANMSLFTVPANMQFETLR